VQRSSKQPAVVLPGERNKGQAKPVDYYAGARADFVREMPDDPDAAILEIGCAEGATGALALKSCKCRRYVGVERHQASAQLARTRLSDVIVGDVENLELTFPQASFDVLVLSEVLEHLVDPWHLLARISEYLKPGGLVFASVPNVSHYSVIAQLLRGQWTLTDSGIMDATHLRWFTPATVGAMFEQSGFSVQRLGPLGPISKKAAFVNWLTFRHFEHLFIGQVTVRALKRGPAVGL